MSVERYQSGLWVGAQYQPDVGDLPLWNLRLDFRGDCVRGTFAGCNGPGVFTGFVTDDGRVVMSCDEAADTRDFYIGLPDGEGGISGEWFMDLGEERRFRGEEAHRNHGYFAMNPVPFRDLQQAGIARARQVLRPSAPPRPTLWETWKAYGWMSDVVDSLRGAVADVVCPFERLVLEVQVEEALLRLAVGLLPFDPAPLPPSDLADQLPIGSRVGLSTGEVGRMLRVLGSGTHPTQERLPTAGA